MPDRALVFLSDTHCGSTVGLLHPDGVMHDDGVRILPSDVQLYLWERHREFVGDVKREVGDMPAHLFLVGDLVDGDHHGTHQIISNDQGLHVQAAADVLMQGILTLDFETVHAVRGTPSHVGKAAGTEKSVLSKLANRLNREGEKRLIRDPRTDSFVWPHVYAEFNGLLFDVRHHGRSGMRAHTRGPYSKWYAQDIYNVHTQDTFKRRPPDVAIRAHKHKYMDSGPDHRGITRAIQLPCWQLGTEWTGYKSIEDMPDIGGLVLLVRESGHVDVRPLLYMPEPDPQPIWRPAA